MAMHAHGRDAHRAHQLLEHHRVAPDEEPDDLAQRPWQFEELLFHGGHGTVLAQRGRLGELEFRVDLGRGFSVGRAHDVVDGQRPALDLALDHDRQVDVVKHHEL